MNLEQQEKILDNFYAKRMEVMHAKSLDYASDRDVLDNFKNVAAIVGVTPAQQCLSLITVKVSRIGNILSSGKTPSNEALEDSVLDMANYTDLLYCLLKEENVKEDFLSKLKGFEAISDLTPHVVDFVNSDNKELTPEEAIKKFNEQPLMYNDKPIEDINEYNLDGSDLSLLEDNTWYIYPNGTIQFNIEKGKGYGFTFDGSWVDNAEWLANKDNSFYRKATEQEIGKALINEANTWYKIGDDIRLNNRQNEHIKWNLESGYNYTENKVYFNGSLVFDNGSWAEVQFRRTDSDDLDSIQSDTDYLLGINEGDVFTHRTLNQHTLVVKISKHMVYINHLFQDHLRGVSKGFFKQKVEEGEFILKDNPKENPIYQDETTTAQ